MINTKATLHTVYDQDDVITVMVVKDGNEENIKTRILKAIGHPDASFGLEHDFPVHDYNDIMTYLEHSVIKDVTFPNVKEMYIVGLAHAGYTQRLNEKDGNQIVTNFFKASAEGYADAYPVAYGVARDAGSFDSALDNVDLRQLPINHLYSDFQQAAYRNGYWNGSLDGASVGEKDY